VVNDPDATNACRNKILQGRATQSSGTNDDDCGLLELELTCVRLCVCQARV